MSSFYVRGAGFFSPIFSKTSVITGFHTAALAYLQAEAFITDAISEITLDAINAVLHVK